MTEQLTSPHTLTPHGVPTIVQSDEGQAVSAFGNEIVFKLTAERTGGTLTVGMASVPPGAGPPPHVHHADDELFLIAEGTYRFYIDGEWTEVGAGGVAYLPRGAVHTFQVVGPSPGKHWVLLTPSGFEHFYARCAPEFSKGGPPDFERLVAISAEHGYAFAPPPVDGQTSVRR